jgi:hypothetical protein
MVREGLRIDNQHMPHALDPARGKLERAHESILSLEGEIEIFLQEGSGSVIPKDDQAAAQEAVKHHTSRIIPGRFSILVGEIVHHLRSSLDHVAWQLSSQQKRLSDPSGIEFPIFCSKPMDKSATRRYQRKIEGVGEHGRKIIDALQPYNRDPAFLLTGPVNDPLWIVHEMDRIDKHRELIITLGAFDVAVSGMADIYLMLYRQDDLPEEDVVGLGRSFDPDSKVTTQVAFHEFGALRMQPVIPGLSKLTRYVNRVLDVFASECF